MSYLTVKHLQHWLYSIHDPKGSFCYLVVGNAKALLYDAGYGIASLQETIATITDKPVEVVLGHGHVDHANGAYQFNEVWLHEADFDLFHEHTSTEWRKNITEEQDEKPKSFQPEAYINAIAPKLKKLTVGQIFDLGGLHVEVVNMAGHTPGSMGLLAKEHRVLLNSDAASDHVWMHLPGSSTISQYISMLKRVLTLGFDTFYTGHSNRARPKAEMDKYIQVARNATIEKAAPYEAFNGLIYQEDGVAIVFNQDTLQ
ncbi:MAG: MBL fold metallo-hydrolase [Defluviitaleaceae bacterium]|nr:MBL fold metallo-hydrolase [Defluviitaleaceae bacterium]